MRPARPESRVANARRERRTRRSRRPERAGLRQRAEVGGRCSGMEHRLDRNVTHWPWSARNARRKTSAASAAAAFAKFTPDRAWSRKEKFCSPARERAFPQGVYSLGYSTGGKRLSGADQRQKSLCTRKPTGKAEKSPAPPGRIRWGIKTFFPENSK